ncbi:bifunctional heptose 7-phosphate kinase/heptose 1-phosphate adenyltransferase [Candidatus Latescibacterota bacterium]
MNEKSPDIRSLLQPERIEFLISEFSSRRIAVIGDFFLDKYLDVDPAIAETSLETEKTANQVISVRHSPGAAGNVVKNLASLGTGILHAVGLVGEDGEGYELFSDLRHLGCKTGLLLPSAQLMTPTYFKPRDKDIPGLKGEHERYDIKNRNPIPRTLGKQVIEALDSILNDLDGVIIADQVEEPGCGVITDMVREALSERAANHEGIVFLADSRSRIRTFRNIMVKPNQYEATGIQRTVPEIMVDRETLKKSAQSLHAEISAPVFITCGERGIMVCSETITEVPAVRLDGELDTTGAGDSAAGGIVLALSSGATEVEAAIIGNLAASITAEQLDTTGTATPEELVSRCAVWKSQE